MKVPVFDGRGERNPSAKLSLDDVVNIRTSTKTGKQLAAIFDVDYAHICAIKRGRAWKHL
jgi:hypothetical protein